MSNDTAQDNKRAELRRAALEYHEFPTPGQIAIGVEEAHGGWGRAAGG